MVTPEERNWATAAHLIGLATFLFLPGVNILGPLIIWRLKKDELPYAAGQALESLNFQITISVCLLVAFLLMSFTVGVFLFPLIGIIDILMVIMAALKTTQGEGFVYPLSLRLIS